MGNKSHEIDLARNVLIIMGKVVTINRSINVKVRRTRRVERKVPYQAHFGRIEHKPG